MRCQDLTKDEEMALLDLDGFRPDPILDLKRWMRIRVSWVWAGSADRTLERDLERIAECAPHCLEDLGFARDTEAGLPGCDLWRRGAARIVVERDTGRASARVERGV